MPPARGAASENISTWSEASLAALGSGKPQKTRFVVIGSRHTKLGHCRGIRWRPQFELLFSSPGVYAWDTKGVIFKSPINGASLLTANANPALNGWAREI